MWRWGGKGGVIKREVSKGGGGWPSKTGNPSGGSSTNNPPSK